MVADGTRDEESGYSFDVGDGVDDHTVKLWNATTGECIRTFNMHTEPVYSVAFSPDGKHVASGSFDKRVRVWEIATGLLEKDVPRGEGGSWCVGTRKGRRLQRALATTQ